MRMSTDIRTKAEVERDARHRKVINEFLDLSGANPDASPSRIINKVAEMNNLTSMGVRRILERNHILSSNK